MLSEMSICTICIYQITFFSNTLKWQAALANICRHKIIMNHVFQFVVISVQCMRYCGDVILLMKMVAEYFDSHFQMSFGTYLWKYLG